MRVAITGYRGFIGSNLLNSLPNDWSVRYYDLLDNSNLRASDLELNKVDWVFHIGAISSTTESDWLKIQKLNITFSIELFERCVDAGVNFQFSSSASVYGSSTSFKEIDIKKPDSYYAVSKAIVEDYITYRNPTNIRYQLFRYFNVFGSGEEHKIGQSSPHTEFARQARTTGKIKLFKGSEYFKRDFVPVETVVDTHFKMVESKDSGVWNVGTGKPVSFYDIALDTSKKFGAQIQEIPFPDHLKNSYQTYTCADTNKLVSTLSKIGKIK